MARKTAAIAADNRGKLEVFRDHQIAAYTRGSTTEPYGGSAVTQQAAMIADAVSEMLFTISEIMVFAGNPVPVIVRLEKQVRSLRGIVRDLRPQAPKANAPELLEAAADD